MKRLFLLLVACFATSACFADVSHASLIPVKATHPKVHRHHAHKAVKHHTPKRKRHAV